MIHLEDITPDNWREELKVSKEQERYVSDAMKILARAYAFRNQRSYACIIYEEGEPIGMALYYDCDELQAYDFSQLFIDERYQGRGYGKMAAKLILDRMRKEMGLEFSIEVDGGIKLSNVEKVLNCKADIIVAGSAVFKDNIADNVKQFKSIIAKYDGE